MDFKTKITQNLRSSTSDKEALNRQILKWHKSLKEVEKIINRKKSSKKGINQKERRIILMEKIFTTENFEMEVLKSDKPVLVDFYADWCGPCKMMAPLIEKMAEEFSDSAVIGKLNVDDNEEIAMKYQVMNIPTLILFKNGAAVNRLVGVQSREILEKLLR